GAEGAGEGPRPPLRIRQHLRRGRRALPGGGGGAGPPAQRLLPAPEGPAAEPGAGAGGRPGVPGPGDGAGGAGGRGGPGAGGPGGRPGQDAGAADAARRQARAALQTLSDKVIGGLLGKQPRLGDREKQFLRDVRKFYEEFAESQGETELARENRATG